jgi:hypothetical protein
VLLSEQPQDAFPGDLVQEILSGIVSSGTELQLIF